MGNFIYGICVKDSKDIEITKVLLRKEPVFNY
jgi:hypothetical protein